MFSMCIMYVFTKKVYVSVSQLCLFISVIAQLSLGLDSVMRKMSEILIYFKFPSRRHLVQ